MKDAYPEWPCPYCGHTEWSELFARPMRRCERLNPVVCSHCNVLFNANWVDGCWMGRMCEAEWPGALATFVEMKAEALRGEREWGAVPLYKLDATNGAGETLKQPANDNIHVGHEYGPNAEYDSRKPRDPAGIRKHDGGQKAPHLERSVAPSIQCQEREP